MWKKISKVWILAALFVFAALPAGQVFDVLDSRGLDQRKAIAAIGGLDFAQQVFAQLHVGGKLLGHPLHRGFNILHVRPPSEWAARRDSAAI